MRFPARLRARKVGLDQCEAAAAVASRGKVMVTDENGNTAHVTTADVIQSNGVIHVVDKVLLPK